MFDFLIRQNWTPHQVKRAVLKAAEFRRNRYTSGSAHLDDLICLGKAIVLCEAHARRFSPRAARYEPHPDPKLLRVIGSCDVCRGEGLHYLYVNGSDAVEFRRSWEQFRRDREYATIATG